MTRDQLKKIIKECLVEILAEGVGNSLTEHIQRPAMGMPRPPAPLSNRPSQAPARRPSSLDHMRLGPHAQQPRQSSTMPDYIRQATTDPVLASIFADTAQTTMIQQTEGRHSAPVNGGRAEQIVASYNPDELMAGITGQSADQMNARWSQAAFAPTNRLPGMSSQYVTPDYDPYSSCK